MRITGKCEGCGKTHLDTPLLLAKEWYHKRVLLAEHKLCRECAAVFAQTMKVQGFGAAVLSEKGLPNVN